MNGQEDYTTNTKRHLGIALLVALITSAVSFTVWRLNSTKLISSKQESINITGQYLASQFRSILELNVQALDNLKGRLEETEGEYFEFWEYDAELMRKQHDAILFVEWIDSNMIIQRANPYEENKNAIGLNIGTLDYRKYDWLKAVADSTINITHWLKLVQGPYAFLVDDPVYYDTEFQGTITAGMDFTNDFIKVVSGNTELFVKIQDEQGNVFFTHGDSSGAASTRFEPYREKIPLYSKDDHWEVSVYPNTQMLEGWFFKNGGIGLLLGLLFSFLLSVSVYYIDQSKSIAASLEKLIGHQKKLYTDLEVEKERAEEASKAKSEFLSNMSHEVRTPLSGIIGVVELMKLQELSEPLNKFLSMLEISSRNLVSLVNDVLDLDKIESGNLELQENEFSPKKEIENIVDLFKPSFEEKGLELDLKLDGFMDWMVTGDKIKFSQVMSNLIRNAFKFTEAGGLSIKARSTVINQHLEVKMEFRDTGIGIPKEKWEYIFERFTQIDSNLSREYEGTGLGLSISKKILELMGGSIDLDSEPGKGTIFFVEVRFPMIETTRKTIPNEPDHSSDIDFSNFKALIVDDIEINQIVLEKVLERYRIDVDVAENGETGVDKASRNNYDIIFMDLHMPKKDGFQAIKELRELGVKTPIITLTANVTQEAMNRSRELGSEEYITKPYSSWRIYSVLQKYLKNSGKS